ncbi:Cpped1 [Symbiodinium sp. KB8]|nr:Cpped1 [Symbiodinium sp. KB8]
MLTVTDIHFHACTDAAAARAVEEKGQEQEKVREEVARMRAMSVLRFVGVHVLAATPLIPLRRRLQRRKEQQAETAEMKKTEAMRMAMMNVLMEYEEQDHFVDAAAGDDDEGDDDEHEDDEEEDEDEEQEQEEEEEEEEDLDEDEEEEEQEEEEEEEEEEKGEAEKEEAEEEEEEEEEAEEKRMRYIDPEDWTAERNMLDGLVSKTVPLNPSFVFVGGDMQNWWPNEGGQKDRNRPGGMSDADFQELCSKNLGRKQRASVREALEGAGIPVYYTPGNHDIGDHPDVQTLERYVTGSSGENGWGPLFQRVKQEGGILYLQFNSQVYWSTAEVLDDYRAKQLEFLQAEVSNMNSNIKRLVLLTHIPPFMSSVDEKEGWANWKQVYRKQILDLLSEPRVPMLWVCGHFHANVETDVTYQGVPMSIRVTSAAGTTMQWDGLNELTSQQAETVASKDIANAFAEDIEFSKIKQRLRAQPDRSGLRIFRFDEDDGSFEDQWYTLDQLDKKPEA